MKPVWILFWRHLKPALTSPAKFAGLALRILALLKNRGLRGTLEKFSHKSKLYDEYPRWIALYDTPTDKEQARIRSRLASFAHTPRISLLMTCDSSIDQQTFAAIHSLQAQNYSQWQLCIASRHASEHAGRKALEALASADARINIFTAQKGSQAATCNALLARATGEWVSLVETHCELAPHALYWVAQELVCDPNAEVIYSDEDQIDDEGRRCAPCFKPDWNPDLLLSHNYLGNLTFYRTDRLRQQGGFNSEAEGSLPWELALRLSEGVDPKSICHIPRVLCHVHAGQPKRFIPPEAGRQMLETYLHRNNIQASVSLGRKGYWRVRYALPAPPPLVSIIIPTRNGLKWLSQCVEGVLKKTDYLPFEIIVVDNQSSDRQTLEYLRQLEKDGSARVLSYNAPFNYSAINNFAVTHAKGEFLCLLNNDIEVIDPQWLEEMVSQAARPEVGAVGAMLYYPDGSIQHAGVLLKGKEAATHFFARMPAALLDARPRAQMVQSVSAVTAACLVVAKKKFLLAGGFDENLTITCNDIDLCLKLAKGGLWNIWTPFAALYHHESATRGFDDNLARQARIGREKSYLYEHWASVLDNDPAYNPNLDLNTESYALAFPPRISAGDACPTKPPDTRGCNSK